MGTWRAQNFANVTSVEANSLASELLAHMERSGSDITVGSTEREASL